MKQSDFQYHDLSQFPLVFTRHRGAAPGYAPAWVREMELLTASTQPFVLITLDMDEPIDHEDRKVMVQWQTENIGRIRQACCGFVAVKPDISGLEKTRQRAEKMTRAFDFPFLVVSGVAEARAEARRLLDGRAGQTQQ